jgi:DNA-binding helix-hairpin-helix protein with protein kinase domain
MPILSLLVVCRGVNLAYSGTLMRDVYSYLKQNETRFVGELCDYLRFPSVSAQSQHRGDLKRCAHWLARKCQSIGLKVEVVATEGNPIVLARTPRRKGTRPHFLVYGHYDVQSPEPFAAWKSAPFEPVVRKGRIYARGASDNKAQHLAHLNAVEAYLKTGTELPCDLTFLVEGEEEVGSGNLRGVLEQRVKELRCDGVVIADSSMPSLGQPALSYGLRGNVGLEVTIHGPKQDLHSGIELHDAYGPKSRMVKLPQAKFKFLTTVAYNLCAALHEIHSVGAVVGDFNQRNILVSENASVRFVDCDSFQVRSGSEVFRCLVGTPDQLAPEIQEKDLAQIVRVPNQDNFTLAVLLFQTLFLGRHPFAGTGGPDLELPKAIQRHLYAYGRNGVLAGIKPPPQVPSLDIVTPAMAGLFERAFSPGTDGSGRPTATDWANELKALLGNIATCRVVSSHEYRSARSSCPWCDLYSRFQVTFFLLDGQHAFRIDAHTFSELADRLLRAQPIPLVIKIPPPGPLQPFTPPPGLNQKPASFWGGLVVLAVAAVGLSFGYWFIAIFIGLWGVQLVVQNNGRARREFRGRLVAADLVAEKTMTDGRGRLKSFHSRYVQDFERQRAKVNPLKQEYADLPAERQRRIVDLNRRLAELQLKEFLDQCFIGTADIIGIGQKRKDTLRAYSIETAGDVSWQMHVPGFARDLKSKLMAWRNRQEQMFRFDPSRKVDPREIQKIDAALFTRKHEIETELSAIKAGLERISRKAQTEIELGASGMAPAAAAGAQARADLAAFEASSQKPSTTAPAKASSSSVFDNPVVMLVGLAVVGILLWVVFSKPPARDKLAAAIPRPVSTPTLVLPGKLSVTTNVPASLQIGRIDSANSPAAIVIDHSDASQPAELDQLPPGSYRVTGTARGWQHPKSVDITITSGAAAQAALNFEATIFYFTSSPDGAVVKENGAALGTTPFWLKGASREPHTFVFQHPDCSEAAVPSDPQADKTMVDCTWPPGSVLIESNPTGAQVLDGGALLGNTPLQLPARPRSTCSR